MDPVSQLVVYLCIAGNIGSTLANEIPMRKNQELQPPLGGSETVPSSQRLSVPRLNRTVLDDPQTSLINLPNGQPGKELHGHRYRRSHKYIPRNVNYHKRRARASDYPDANDGSTKPKPRVYGISGSNIRIYHGKQEENKSPEFGQSYRSPRNKKHKKRPRFQNHGRYNEESEYEYDNERRASRRQGPRHDSMGWSINSKPNDY
ncbi:unnamed protein product [Nezara viridula]|uniref:Uncharacterized protein n=1 Tax=Nezara viridula TaxID=85310 RepID=A0A9P0E7J0_NEZVI|nr:unnamed protein product [Nezara viridula]